MVIHDGETGLGFGLMDRLKDSMIILGSIAAFILTVLVVIFVRRYYGTTDKDGYEQI